jgi:hypothetical protein
MAFFRNILSSKRVDTDVEAANNHSDVELDEMEAGSGSAHYPQPAHYPHSLSDLESIPLLPLSNIPAMAMDSMVGMQSDTNQKLLSSNRDNVKRDLESGGHTSIYPPLLPLSNIPAIHNGWDAVRHQSKALVAPESAKFQQGSHCHTDIKNPEVGRCPLLVTGDEFNAL